MDPCPGGLDGGGACGVGGGGGGGAGGGGGGGGGGGRAIFLPINHPHGHNPTIDKRDLAVAMCCFFCCSCCCCILLVVLFIFGLLVSIILADPSLVDTTFQKWAVVCDAPHCANVAKEMFDKGGAIGDAAVAALLCMGVTAPHVTGIGGGLMAVLYDKSTMKVQALDALGVSPASVTPDMFSTNASALKLGGSSSRSASAPIVPGALAGLKALHTKVGKLPWKDVFQPAIRLAKKGFAVGSHLAAALANNENVLSVSASLRKRFSNSTTGALLRQGDKLVQVQLSELLAKLAERGPEYLYQGELADEIEKNIADAGGSLRKSDLSRYQPVWQDPLSSRIGCSQHIHSAPIPGAGVVLAVAVHQINVAVRSHVEIGIKHIYHPTMTPARIHHFVEALKFALAKRPDLGDDHNVKVRQTSIVTDVIGFAAQNYDKAKPLASPQNYGIKYAPDEDFGGAQLTIVGPTGDALSVTSGLNGMFGSGFESSSGLLLNNYMDAFAKPRKQFNLDPSPANQLGPGKRPMTSMVPTIITKSATPSELVGAFGGSGGLPAISTVAQLITCVRNYTLPRCVWSDARVQPTFRSITPNSVFAEPKTRFFDPLITCVRNYTLPRCVWSDARVQPTFRSITPNSVFAEPKTRYFDPVSLLRKLGDSVTQKTIMSAATGIIVTKSGSFLAPSDVRHVDGSRSGA
ncbi:scoloptoxin SSD14-like [Dermacentor albipictus]|uniref:scoloptoxin SSD14-like n=1 Tax=Dermacentor albipictus TaxID=60249 RepID=UPI0031FC615F